MSPSRIRIEFLDGLRSIAAMSVVIQHTVEPIIAGDPALGPYLKPVFADFFNAGRFGVALFFLISGFVVPFSLKEPHPIRGFAISRFFRLYPAYWVSIVLAISVFPFFTDKHFSLVQIAANVTMAQALFGQSDVNGAYWTLLIELIFYVACAGLYAVGLLSDCRALATAIVGSLCLSLIMAVYASAHGTHLPANLFLNISLMFLGTLMRRNWLEHDATAKSWTVPAIMVWASFVPPILWLTPSRASMPIEPLSFCIAYWSALLLFVAAMNANRPKSRILVALGMLSYSLYLVHGVCLEVMLAIIPPMGFSTALIFVCGMLVSSIVVAAIMFYAIERPAMKLGRAILKRGQASKTPAQAILTRLSNPDEPEPISLF